jgi:hypothetical protein
MRAPTSCVASWHSARRTCWAWLLWLLLHRRRPLLLLLLLLLGLLLRLRQI